MKKIGSTGSIAEKMEVLNAEFNERAEPVTSNYSVTLFCIFSKYTVKNNYSVIILYSIFILCQWLRIIRPSSQDVWFMNFPSQIFYNNIDHGYRAAILKEIFLWLLPFYMVVATYFYYDEKVHRKMCTAIVSNLLKTVF